MEPSALVRGQWLQLPPLASFLDEWGVPDEDWQYGATSPELDALKRRCIPHKHRLQRLTCYVNWLVTRIHKETVSQRRAHVSRFLTALSDVVVAPLSDELTTVEAQLIERFLPDAVRQNDSASRAPARPTAELIRALRNRLQAVRYFPILNSFMKPDFAEVLRAEVPKVIRKPMDELKQRASAVLGSIDAGDSPALALSQATGLEPWMARLLRGRSADQLGNYADNLFDLASDLAIIPPAAAPRTHAEFRSLWHLMRGDYDLASFRDALTYQMQGADLAALRRLLSCPAGITDLADYERFLHDVRRLIGNTLPGPYTGGITSLLGTRSIADWLRMSRIWHRLHLEVSTHIETGMGTHALEVLSWPSPFEGPVLFQDLEFHPLTSGKELHEEGRQMQHCVASYLDQCARGECVILSIRSGTQRIATLELGVENIGTPDQSFTVCQAKEVGNAPPSSRTDDAIDRFVQAANARQIPVRLFSKEERDCIEQRLKEVEQSSQDSFLDQAIRALGVELIDHYRPCLEARPGVGSFYALARHAVQVRCERPARAAVLVAALADTLRAR